MGFSVICPYFLVFTVKLAIFFNVYCSCNYLEITTWDRNVRKDTEKEQGNQEEANDDTLVGDENVVN